MNLILTQRPRLGCVCRVRSDGRGRMHEARAQDGLEKWREGRHCAVHVFLSSHARKRLFGHARQINLI
jgi:hypothetical protein